MVKTKFKRPKKSSAPSEGFDLPGFDSSPDGLVPIGDTGFYATPDEPADPRDCDRYPNSFYCGSHPFTETPVGIEPVIIIDECNIGIQLTPVIAYVGLPPVSLVYRKKECRDIPEQEQPEQELPEEEEFSEPFKFLDPGCVRGVAGIIYTDHECHIKRIDKNVLVRDGLFGYRNIGDVETNTYSKRVIEILEINFPYKVRYLFNGNNDLAFCHIKVKILEVSSVGFDPEIHDSTNVPFGYPDTRVTVDSIEDHWIVDGYLAGRTSISFASVPQNAHVGQSFIDSRIVEGIQYIKDHENVAGVSVTDNDSRTTITRYKYTGIPIILCEDPVKPKPPPIRHPKKKKMDCCPDLAALLVNLTKKVDKLSKIVGVDDYPVSLPTSLISKDEGFLGNLIPNFNEDVPSLTRFLAWYVGRFDEIMGQWEIPIEIKDSDPSKPGDQPLGVKLPNMAEAIAEMFTLAFQTNVNSETLLNMLMRTMADSAADKQQNFISYKLLQSLTDYVGFKQKDIKLKMPLLFTLGKSRYDEILKESEVEVVCTEFDDKFGLEADLMRFREAAAILAAVHKKKIDPTKDIKAQVLKYLLDTLAATNKVNTDEEDDNFEQFIEDVETGFTNAPGMKDAVNPYGRPFTLRPKIRDLTKYVPPTNP